MSSWLAMLQDAAEMFVFLAVELSLLFIVISAGVSLIRQKVPDHKIQQMMGARKGRGYLLAALLGAVTPFCSCSTIPMLRGLLSAKAGFGPTLTFLFVSPLLNPIIVGLMWMTFGWKVTLLYAIGFAPIFPDTCYHLTHYWPAAADIPVASDNPVHYADAIRYNARTPLQGSLLPLTRLV